MDYPRVPTTSSLAVIRCRAPSRTHSDEQNGGKLEPESKKEFLELALNTPRVHCAFSDNLLPRARFRDMRNNKNHELKLHFFMGRFFADAARGSDERALRRIDGEVTHIVTLLEQMGMPIEARAFLRNFIRRAGENRKAEIRIMLHCR